MGNFPKIKERISVDKNLSIDINSILSEKRLFVDNFLLYKNRY